MKGFVWTFLPEVNITWTVVHYLYCNHLFKGWNREFAGECTAILRWNPSWPGFKKKKEKVLNTFLKQPKNIQMLLLRNLTCLPLCLSNHGTPDGTFPKFFRFTSHVPPLNSSWVAFAKEAKLKWWLEEPSVDHIQVVQRFTGSWAGWLQFEAYASRPFGKPWCTPVGGKGN